MRCKAVVLLVVMAVIVYSIPALSQQVNFNFIGAGARARGMGGAFIGVADDATAISWNPAGLATLERPEGSIVGYYSASKYNIDIENLVGTEYSESHPVFNFGSIAYPLATSGKNFVIAGAYQRLIDLYGKSETDDGNETWETKGGVDAISPGVGIQLTPEVAVGAAFNIWTGGTDYKYENKSNPSLNIDQKNLDKFSGFNVNIGVLAQFQQVKVGAVVKTPLTLTDEYTQNDSTYKDKFKFPMTYGFGISFAPNENLTLAADVDIRPYSKTDIVDGMDDTTYSGLLNNTTQIRAGMEYLFIGESAVFPVRLGFHTEPLIQNPFYPSEDATVSGNYFTAGFGVIFGNIWFDLAYEIGTVKTDSDVWFAGYNSTYKLTRQNVILSAIVHFE